MLRDSTWQDIAASQLVPGDIIEIRLGNILPADCKLLEGEYLRVDQSALTGESLPVDKKSGEAAYSGSVARQGEMKALVTATGMHTYFGKTAQLVQQAKRGSHFQRAVLRIGNFLISHGLMCNSVQRNYRLKQAPRLADERQLNRANAGASKMSPVAFLNPD